MTAPKERRALAAELLQRARLEPLANVRANFEAAAARWNAIADREEYLAHESARKSAKLRAELAARLSAPPP